MGLRGLCSLLDHLFTIKLQSLSTLFSHNVHWLKLIHCTWISPTRPLMFLATIDAKLWTWLVFSYDHKSVVLFGCSFRVLHQFRLLTYTLELAPQEGTVPMGGNCPHGRELTGGNCSHGKDLSPREGTVPTRGNCPHGDNSYEGQQSPWEGTVLTGGNYSHGRELAPWERNSSKGGN